MPASWTSCGSCLCSLQEMKSAHSSLSSGGDLPCFQVSGDGPSTPAALSFFSCAAALIVPEMVFC